MTLPSATRIGDLSYDAMSGQLKEYTAHVTAGLPVVLPTHRYANRSTSTRPMTPPLSDGSARGAHERNSTIYVHRSRKDNREEVWPARFPQNYTLKSCRVHEKHFAYHVEKVASRNQGTVTWLRQKRPMSAHTVWRHHMYHFPTISFTTLPG